MYLGTKTQQRKSFSESLFICDTHTVTHVGATMASDDVLSVLEECVKTINANTAQPENFLRQVFAVCLYACVVKKLLKVVVRRGRMFKEKRRR